MNSEHMHFIKLTIFPQIYSSAKWTTLGNFADGYLKISESEILSAVNDIIS